MKANMEIRQEAAKAGVKLWWIADKLGIADTGLSKKLRHELPDEEKKNPRDHCGISKGGVSMARMRLQKTYSPT